MNIKWVNRKDLDLSHINKRIIECIDSKHFTNNGKNVLNLRKRIKSIFKIDDNKEVLMVCNGAMGINALVSGMNIFYGKKLVFAVQSFTFPCSKQGMLYDSILFDVDENMGPNILELEQKKELFDGIMITNCFGCSANIAIYETFCKKNNKILLFDNAAASYTIYRGTNHLNYGEGSMVSLHHTKPIGFGEGGFIIFDHKYLSAMERAICFGYTDTNKFNFDQNASNYKMSEIAAIFIDEYLNNLDNILAHHRFIIKYFKDQIENSVLRDHITLFTNYADYGESLLSTIPVLFKQETHLQDFITEKVEAKKYYYPLSTEHTKSMELFKNIVCLPLNMDVTTDVIDFYIKIIGKMIMKASTPL